MALFSTPDTSSRRLLAIEKKLDLIIQHLGIEAEEQPMDDIAQLARNGREIEAIKLYRERTGAGLMEAKNAVDAMERG